MKVEVYFNLHKQLFSIRAMEGEDNGRVIGHIRSVAIRDAEFVVQKSGRNRVLREEKKNVHAFIRGEWKMGGYSYFRDELELETKPEKFGTVSYNPYRSGSFQQICGHDSSYSFIRPHYYRDITRAGFVCCYLNNDGNPTIVFDKDYGAEGPAFRYGGMNSEALA